MNHTHPRMLQAVDADMEFADLVRFIPGSPIAALANMCAVHSVTAHLRANILAAAGIVKFERTKTGNSTKLVYPK